MKRVLAVVLIAMLMLPGMAWAGSSRDAALGLGAFAALGTILLGAAALSGAVLAPPPVVAAPPPVVYEPPPAVYAPPPPPPVVYAPPPVVYAPAPPPVVYAPPPPVYGPPVYGRGYDHRPYRRHPDAYSYRHDWRRY